MAEKKTAEELAKEAEEKAAKDALATMQGMIEKLPGDIQAGFSKALGEVATAQAAAAAKAAADAGDDDEEDKALDIERLSNTDLTAYMIGKMTKEVNKLLKPIATRLDESSADQEKANVGAQVDKMRAKHEDFDQWKPEMAAVLKANPGMKLESLYKLAKVDNPDKVKELAEKAAEEGGENKNKGKSTEKFLGLMPTNTSGNDNDEETGSMSPKEAADAAFDEVFKDIPAEMFGT